MFNAAILGLGIWMMIGAFFYPNTTAMAVTMFALGVGICAPIVVIYLARRPSSRTTATTQSDLIAKAAEEQEKRIEQLRGKSEPGK